MHLRKQLYTGLLCVLSSLAHAQSTGSLRGRISSEQGDPLPGVTVMLAGTTKGINTDESGNFQLDNLLPGTHTLTVSFVGYQPQQKTVTTKAGEIHRHNFRLISATHELETVSVIGRSEAKEVNRQAFNVTAIDATKLHNSTLDLSHALDRVSGVRVRESGGVGSNFNFSLNGFTGRQVKFFIDGIPMDNFGSSFQLNNIPINLAERVDVYKGVVPIWLGSDALGTP